MKNQKSNKEEYKSVKEYTKNEFSEKKYRKSTENKFINFNVINHRNPVNMMKQFVRSVKDM